MRIRVWSHFPSFCSGGGRANQTCTIVFEVNCSLRSVWPFGFFCVVCVAGAKPRDDQNTVAGNAGSGANAYALLLELRDQRARKDREDDRCVAYE